jgi:glycosyltransferase involved in cell wall biosynthesis
MPMSAPSNALTPDPALAGILPPQRILHVFRAPVGGLFRHVADVARLQARAGHAVGLFCDASTGGERAERTLAALAPDLALGVVRVPMRRNPHASDVAALTALAAFRRRVGATVLHGHGSKGGVYARLVAPGPSRPIRAYTPHGGSFNYKPGTPMHRLYMAAEAMLTRRTDVLLFESAYIAGRHEAYVGARGRLSCIVPNGICESEFAPVAVGPEAHDLVYVGELREAKGIGFLLQALARLRAQGGRRPNLLVVGAGPDAATLAAQVAILGLTQAVTFVPPCPIREALARGRIMVVPSLAESLPYVVLEAAAAAHPIVATNVGGIPEIFGPFADALVPPRDAAALAEAIGRACDEAPEARQARAEALSHHVASRFSMTRMGEGVLTGYAAALRGRGQPFASAAPVLGIG